MKTLQLMALAILFAIAGTSFIDAKASNGSCNKHRHLKTSGGGCKTSCKKGKCRTRCTKIRTTCEWDKGYPKKPKAVSKPIPGTIYNMLADSMAITFYTAQGGNIVDAGLPKDNGVSMIGSNPSADNSTVDENGYPWSVSIPAGATFVKFGPTDAAMDVEAEGSLSGLAMGKVYKIESDYSDVEDLVMNTCSSPNCQ